MRNVAGKQLFDNGIRLSVSMTGLRIDGGQLCISTHGCANLSTITPYTISSNYGEFLMIGGNNSRIRIRTSSNFSFADLDSNGDGIYEQSDIPL